MSKNIKAVPTSEYNAVIDTANQYVEGLRVGSAESVACPHNQRDFGYVLTLAELEGGIGVFQRFRNTFDMLDMAVGDLR